MHAVEVSDGQRGTRQGSAQLFDDAVAAPNGMHSFRDTGPTPLRQISSFSTSDPLSRQIAPMTRVCRRVWSLRFAGFAGSARARAQRAGWGGGVGPEVPEGGNVAGGFGEAERSEGWQGE